MKEASPRFSRRTTLGLAAGFATASPLRVIAAEPGLDDGQAFVPDEKKLDPKRVEELFARGKPSFWKGDGLKYIGMPIGGLCCGHVYLGGEGQLWMWDLCTTPTGWDMQGLSSGRHYANPMEAHSMLGGVQIEIGGHESFNGPLDSKRWEIEFENRYPIGLVRFRAAGSPIEIDLEGISPFIPLATEDSATPIVVLRYTVRNVSKERLSVRFDFRFRSLCNSFSKNPEVTVDRRSIRTKTMCGEIAECRLLSKAITPPPRDPILFDAFEAATYVGWKVEGTAFGSGPMKVSELPERYQPADPVGTAFVNSHQSRAGEDSVNADRHLGRLSSPEFTIERNFINFRIGGGNHPGKTCINLIVAGKVARTATGRNTLQLRKESFDVKELIGERAYLEIVDQETGGWGHVSIDQISFSDMPDLDEIPPDRLPDFGSMAFAISGNGTGSHTEGLESDRVAHLHRSVVFEPGKEQVVEFAVAWFFPNYGKPSGSFAEITGIRDLKKHYAKRFKSAEDVLRYFETNGKALLAKTRLWADTWYDSTLPHWFLERAVIPIDCLQTSTSHWFDSGRFYGWEGVYCCPGTCQHVWNYAQAAARLFPDLERSAREMADYGISWQPDGTIWYRGESGRHMAHDGQAGTILRTYREHTMCPDSKFLRRNWSKVKKSIERLIAEDPNRDGLWEGEQYNTLDSSWYGKISWISSLYVAALKAGAEMAREMGDRAFAKDLDGIVAKGRDSILAATYNGEYFAMVRDPNHPRAPGSGIGCHIDQVFGDSFLHMVGLSPNLPRDKVRSALRSIWKYNYRSDAGGYYTAMQSVIKGGRWYAMPGEPGMVMTTFPRGGAHESKGEGNPDWMVGYFNECMNGFEYQAAAHMIAEGMVAEGFAVVRSLHDRYAGGKRNPYNEVECSDHYSRSMASYGAFLTSCGFAYHGPNGMLRFDPKVPGTRFKAAFTGATGWGSFEMVKEPRSLNVKVALRYGRLDLTALVLPAAKGLRLERCALGGKPVKAKLSASGISFASMVHLKEGQSLEIVLAG